MRLKFWTLVLLQGEILCKEILLHRELQNKMAIKPYTTQAELLLRNYMLADSSALYTSVIGSICACKIVCTHLSFVNFSNSTLFASLSMFKVDHHIELSSIRKYYRYFWSMFITARKYFFSFFLFSSLAFNCSSFWIYSLLFRFMILAR